MPSRSRLRTVPLVPIPLRKKWRVPSAKCKTVFELVNTLVDDVVDVDEIDEFEEFAFVVGVVGFEEVVFVVGVVEPEIRKVLEIVTPAYVPVEAIVAVTVHDPGLVKLRARVNELMVQPVVPASDIAYETSPPPFPAAASMRIGLNVLETDSEGFQVAV